MAAASEYIKVAQELYISYFGRPADRAGLENMTNALAAANAPTTTAALDAAYKTNATVKSLLDSFGTSPESANLYPGSTSQFVTAVFQNLFGRDPLLAGLDFWTKAIDSGNLTKAAAAHSILTGAITAAGADAALIAKKVTVATNFTTAIDTVAEVNAYSGPIAAGTARAMLSSVTAATDTVAFQTNVTGTLATLVTNAAVGATANLTVQQDAITGTGGNDTFVGFIFDNQNTLQSGDAIVGGAGTDTLRADIGNSQKFALTASTTSVENVVLRAQAISNDSTDNNTSRTSEVQIDAERMNGVLRWENANSRADLLIEDVRILDAQITKDITVAMVSTDPGNVDFGLYFDQHSLRAAPVATSGATLRLQLMDTRANDAGLAPLKDSPYNGFQFTFNGQLVRVASEAIDQAQTYAQLLTAIQTAVAATPGIQNFVVTLGSTFQAADTLSGRVQTGTEIVIKNPGAGTIVLDNTSGWLAAAPVPPSSGLHTGILTAPPDQLTSKITSTIILDDVGRGSNGGDLVIGGLSIGDTSKSIGVERFEITVERNSKLQTINSTDDKLQEVTIVNGAVNKGNLFVNGNVNAPGTVGNLPGVVGVGTGNDFALPGTNTLNGGNQHDDRFGFDDVRLIDASTMTGSVNFTAQITDRSYNKYITLVDNQSGPAADNINFVYSGGNGNDVISVQINSDIAASRSHLMSGLEDFTFTLNGGAGNDELTVRLVEASVNDYQVIANQDLNNNIVINGGEGNNIIRKLGAGDTRINTGAGSDTIYAENTGIQTGLSINPSSVAVAATTANAHWVFNTFQPLTAANRNISNLASDSNEQYNLIGTKVNVTFKGILSTVTTGNVLLNPTATDLEINQAIKAAINTDAVLSKLLIAEDGPANSLVVRSLIDGAMTNADLTVGLVAPTLAQLTTAQITAASAAYGLTGAAATGANVLTAITTSLAAYNLRADYATNAAVDNAAVAIVGAASTKVSDNIITAGAGNDVIVNGTALTGQAATSANDTAVFAAGFGNDTIVNFNATGFGIDHLDFTALGGTTLTAALTTDKSITIVAAAAANDTVAKVGGLFNADNGKAQTHVYAVVDSTNNAASIYSIVDAAGANNAVATLQGTIDLATTNWLTELTAANFVDSSAANYHLIEGAFGFVPPVVVPPAPTTTQLTGTTGSFNAGAADVGIIVHAVAHTAGISNFAKGDTLVFAAGTAVTFNDTNTGDNFVTVIGTKNGVVTTLDVNAPVGTNLGPINTVAAFNAANGGAGIVIAAPVATPVAATGTVDAGTGVFSYDIANAGTYTYNIANFSAHDVLNFVTAGTTLAITNASTTDGIIDLVATNGANVVTVHLTGLSTANDAAIGNTVANFATVFGTQTVITV